MYVQYNQISANKSAQGAVCARQCKHRLCGQALHFFPDCRAGTPLLPRLQGSAPTSLRGSLGRHLRGRSSDTPRRSCRKPRTTYAIAKPSGFTQITLSSLSVGARHTACDGHSLMLQNCEGLCSDLRRSAQACCVCRGLSVAPLLLEAQALSLLI